MFLANKLMSHIMFASGGDPYFNSVIGLLHMDGASGGTVFTDSSSFNNTITPNNVTTNTTTKKFGSASGYFGTGGSSNYLSLPFSTSQFHIDTKDFTIEAWVYPEARIANAVVYTTNGASSESLFIYIGSTGRVSFYPFSTPASAITPTTIISLNTWTHLAFTRSSGTCRVFINGVLSGQSTFSGTVNCNNSSIGGYSNGRFPGYIDDVRVTLDVARYTADFSVPTGAFPDSL